MEAQILQDDAMNLSKVLEFQEIDTTGSGANRNVTVGFLSESINSSLAIS